ncbi:NUDIX hydrolase [Bacteroidia bacterium]|nr:NUDIX hydrolase [Bacteroidia bacterium]MDB9881780.1 NUDIX hydrolase [Bacteroidia bacterium]
MYHIFHGKHLLILARSTDKIEKHKPDFILKKPEEDQVKEALKLSKRATKALTIALIGSPNKLLDTIFLEFKLVIAAGGLVFNKDNEILLIKRLGRWDLPKGKLKKKEDIETCAVREVEEETGATGLKIKYSLPDTFHTYYRNEKWIVKQTHWYKMSCKKKQNFVPQLEEDIEDVQWFPMDKIKLKELDTYPAIRYIIKKYRKIARAKLAAS